MGGQHVRGRHVDLAAAEGIFECSHVVDVGRSYTGDPYGLEHLRYVSRRDRVP